MNERNEDTTFLPANSQALTSSITQALADVFDGLHDTKQAIGANLDGAFLGLANQIAGIQGDVMAAIEKALMEACAKTAQVQNTIPQFIENQLGAVGGTLNLVDAALAKNKKRLQRLQQPSIKGTADALPQGVPQPLQSVVTTPNPEATSTPSGGSPAGSFLDQLPIFPAPPSAPELQTLVIPQAVPGQYLGLANFPQEVWDKNSQAGVFFSLTPTPLSQGQIAIQNDDGQRFNDAGYLFLNINRQDARPQLTALLQAMRVPEASVTLLSPQDAYNAAVAVFSEPVVQSTYSVYNLPLPPNQQAPAQMPPLPEPGQPIPAPPVSFVSTPALPQAQGQAELPREGAGNCPPPPCPEINFTGLPDALRGLLPNIGLPTKDQICAGLDPIYDWLGVPAPLKIPCTTPAEVWTYMNRWINPQG